MEKKGFKKTGRIWQMSERNRKKRVREVCYALEKEYASPRLGNPVDPIDDLVFIIISNKTSPQTARSTYGIIKATFPTWEQILEADPTELAQILKPAGLWRVKSGQITAAIKKIKDDFGIIDLAQIQHRPSSEIESYLVSLPGVSKKVAKCIMMYTLDIDVLPVDGHVYRIARRLGWTSRNRADQCHEELEALVPPENRFAFHVDCILHGRSICRPREPLCGSCIVNTHCDFYKSERWKKTEDP